MLVWLPGAAIAEKKHLSTRKVVKIKVFQYVIGIAVSILLGSVTAIENPEFFRTAMFNSVAFWLAFMLGIRAKAFEYKDKNNTKGDV